MGSDYIVEAVSVAKALGANGTPVKLQWTREDDIRGGLYRPLYLHRLEAALDNNGKLVGWQHRIVGPVDHGRYCIRQERHRRHVR